MSKTSKVRLTFFGILLLSLLSFLIIYPKVPSFVPGSNFLNKFYPHLGLDLQGGAYLVYEADFSNIDVADKKSSLDGVKDVLEKRIDPHGVKEPNIQVSGENRIILELPGEDNIEEAIKKIGEMPILEFKELVQNTTTTDQAVVNEENEANKKLANEILARALNNEDFATLAREYSEDPGSKDNGGVVDFINQTSLDPAYGDVIFNKLSNNQIYNQIVESQFGYHIIKKLEERGSGENKEVKSQHILFLKKQAETQNEEWINTQLSGKQLKASNVQFDQTTGAAEVSLEFNDEGKDLFAEITKRNIGKPVGIFLDGNAITVPQVNEEITGGKAVISGSFSLAEAKLLSQRLNAGALPVPINLISQQIVGPTLGKESLDKSLRAGIIGFIAVIIFMIIYYKFLGIIAMFALAVYALVVMAIFEAWPVTFTLSGIAGFILSIGMAVDANVLIFERTKEELRSGKALMPSIEDGFKRAWPSIRDSNFSSLITCIILIALGKSMVKGFAVTLTIGILVSMFTAIVVTKNFLLLLLNEKMANKLWLFGVKKKTDKQIN